MDGVQNAGTSHEIFYLLDDSDVYYATHERPIVNYVILGL